MMQATLLLLLGAPLGLPPEPPASPPVTAEPQPAAPGPGAPLVHKEAQLRLEPAGGGALRWVGEGIRARVAPDGTVRFESKRDVVRAFVPLPSALPPGTPTLEGSVRGALSKRRPRRPPLDRDAPGRPELPAGSQITDVCRDLRQTNCIARTDGGLLLGAGGPMELSDFLDRFDRKDPHRHEKARFLAATSELRTALSVRARTELLRDGLLGLRDRLEGIAADEARSGAERRETLFLLWREADPAAGGGREARATIEAFVRRRLPLGSAEAYSEAELARLRALPGGADFEPYAEGGETAR